MYWTNPGHVISFIRQWRCFVRFSSHTYIVRLQAMHRLTVVPTRPVQMMEQPRYSSNLMQSILSFSSIAVGSSRTVFCFPVWCHMQTNLAAVRDLPKFRFGFGAENDNLSCFSVSFSAKYLSRTFGKDLFPPKKFHGFGGVPKVMLCYWNLHGGHFYWDTSVYDTFDIIEYWFLVGFSFGQNKALNSASVSFLAETTLLLSAVFQFRRIL